MLHVLDASTGSTARTLDVSACHDRSIHRICLPSPSLHSSVPLSNYSMFATAAIDNSILLWDLRAPSCTGRYTSHVNRREAIGCAISPCLRFLATGSEDKTARLVDLRMLQDLSRLGGHRDVVSDVAFNPLFPQLATSSYDGTIRFYVDPTFISSQSGI